MSLIAGNDAPTFAAAPPAGHFDIHEVRVAGVVVQTADGATFRSLVADARPVPPAGDAYYYLARGTCAQAIGYGAAATLPDPRQSLPSGMICP